MFRFFKKSDTKALKEKEEDIVQFLSFYEKLPVTIISETDANKLISAITEDSALPEKLKIYKKHLNNESKISFAKEINNLLNQYLKYKESSMLEFIAFINKYKQYLSLNTKQEIDKYLQRDLDLSDQLTQTYISMIKYLLLEDENDI